MNFKPLRDQILIKPSKNENKTKKGIIIPETHKGEINDGEIVAIGPGKRDKKGLHPLNAKVGQKVAYGVISTTEIEIDREIYHIILEEQIIGIIK